MGKSECGKGFVGHCPGLNTLLSSVTHFFLDKADILQPAHLNTRPPSIVTIHGIGTWCKKVDVGWTSVYLCAMVGEALNRSRRTLVLKKITGNLHVKYI